MQCVSPAEEKAASGDYRGAVIEFVCTSGPVTFSELQDFLAPYMEVEGSYEISLKNVVFWAGMSDEFIEVLNDLWGCPELELVPVSPLVYMCGGKAVNLPIAKNIPKKGYKSPHWGACAFVARKGGEI